MRSIREDVHIHADARAVYRRLAALESLGTALPRLFRSAGDGSRRVIPQPTIDASGVPLVIARAEEPLSLTLAPGGGGDSEGPPRLEELRWELQREGSGEAHLTVAAEYRRPVGVAGPLLDLLLHRPRRRQALRDALWHLKELVEAGTEP